MSEEKRHTIKLKDESGHVGWLLSEDDLKSYKEEHNRLESVIRASEKIWEERTFGIAAGGLSLSFSLYSFLVGRGVFQSIDCYMLSIWLSYVLCIFLNYWSHRKSIKICLELQRGLYIDRENRLPYDETRLRKYYAKNNKLMNGVNCVTGVLLFLCVVATLLYPFIASVK